MAPTGSQNPLIYILGEAPGEAEDSLGKQFVGPSGRVLRYRIPKDWENDIRWNNTIRCRPPQNRDPAPIEIEACRPSVLKDIEETKPKAIFGFGNVPLHWAIGQIGVTKWNGKRFPIKIGEHVCWYYPMIHPSAVLRSRKFTPNSHNDFGSDTEFVFALDIKNALAEAETLPEASEFIHTVKQAKSNLLLITGENGSKDVETVKRFLKEASNKPETGFDYETNGLRPYVPGAKILTVSIATDAKTIAFPMYHKEAKWTAKQLNEIEAALEDFLYNSPCLKIVHNLVFELEWSAYFYGRKLVWNSPWADSMVQAYVIDERKAVHSLDFLCRQHFGLDFKAISNLDRKNIDACPLKLVLEYNAIDAKYHRLLFLEQEQEIIRQGLEDVYYEHMKRVPTMALTQLKGVPVDQTVVKRFYDIYFGKRTKIEKALKELDIVAKFEKLSGKEYRPSAPQDIGRVLNDILHIPHENTDEATLSKIKHPICSLTLEWRKANKVLSTYILPYHVDYSDVLYKENGKTLLHPQIHTTLVETGRTSSSSPNIQNQPKRDREAKLIREQVTPGPGKKVVSFDYAGIQGRNVAMESNDKKLVEAFWNHYDIHTDWMYRIQKHYPKWCKEGLDNIPKDIQKEFRHKTKNLFVFPSFFGAQSFSISGNLNIPEEVIKDIQNEFLNEEFSGVGEWQERILSDYYEKGYVTGLSGYRRRAPISRNELINAPIQADEALIACNAMARLSALGDERLQANILVHDDLTFIWDKKDIDELSEIVITEMLRVEYDWINVPLAVESMVGDHWAKQEEIGTYESTRKGGWIQIK